MNKALNAKKLFEELTLKEYLQLFNFNKTQIQEIEWGIHDDIDVSPFANCKYAGTQMAQIHMGLADKLDISKFSDVRLRSFQMEEIRLGLKSKIDVTVYNRPSIDKICMCLAREHMEEGYNPENLRNLFNGKKRVQRSDVEFVIICDRQRRLVSELHQVIKAFVIPEGSTIQNVEQLKKSKEYKNLVKLIEKKCNKYYYGVTEIDISKVKALFLKRCERLLAMKAKAEKEIKPTSSESFGKLVETSLKDLVKEDKTKGNTVPRLKGKVVLGTTGNLEIIV